MLTFLGFKVVPVGFIPIQDQGYLLGLAQLPDGASLQRSDEVRQQMVRLASTVPGVAHTVEVTGCSGIDWANRSNTVTTFLTLAPFSERVKDPKQNGFAILAEVQRRFATIQDARVVVFPPPPVLGVGNTGGFKLQIQDRRGAGLPALQAATDALIAKAAAQPEITTEFTTFRSQVPEIYLDIDRTKIETLGVPINSVFDTLQTYLGSSYVNDFNFLTRVDQVYIQADNAFRRRPESIRGFYIRNLNNEMVPLSTLLHVTETTGPDKVMHYNVYPSADISGTLQTGFSTGQAIDTMEKLAAETFAPAVRLRMDRFLLQQILAGNSALYIFPLCVLFVVLAAYTKVGHCRWPSS